MGPLDTNLTLRINRLPALSTAQGDFLRGYPDLEQRFATALAVVDSAHHEGDSGVYLNSVGEPELSRIFLYALIGELSVLVPSADAELAELQARVRSYLAPETHGPHPRSHRCARCGGDEIMSV